MQRERTRREVLTGTIGLAALSSCGRNRKRGAEPLVSITRAEAYDQRLYGVIRDIVSRHKPEVRGKWVVLKPNLVEFDPGTCINTHPVIVHAALEAFRALGAAKVTIAEGPGHRRSTLDLADAAGYFAVIPKFESLFTDLNLDEVTKTALRRRESKLGSVYLPNTALGCDLLVSLPKMKTHHWVGATLSMKNFFGLVPGGVYGWPKNILHWAGIDECIVDLHATFPRAFALVDGVQAMEGNGPIQGTSKSVGVLVAGADLAAVDATCCRIMGLDPAKVKYLKLASTFDETTEANVRQMGEPIRAVRTRFKVIPEFRSLYLGSA